MKVCDCSENKVVSLMVACSYDTVICPVRKRRSSTCAQKMHSLTLFLSHSPTLLLSHSRTLALSLFHFLTFALPYLHFPYSTTALNCKEEGKLVDSMCCKEKGELLELET